MGERGFYLGRGFDLRSGNLSETAVYYDPEDLTTHAVVTGMTGSGKTGLCISILEEAALKGIPAIVIDPKGDLTNLLLHFPNLSPEDFQPWIDPEIARREGKSLNQAALDASREWRQGLTDWSIPQERLQALKDSIRYAIFTPGSDAGIPINILSSLSVPELSWENHREALREKITSTVSALLGLVGYKDIDPVKSREHILLANIFENRWRQGKDIDLAELILQTQSPPFDKLGAFSIEAFYPDTERKELALALNNFLAAPAFEIWRSGEAMDIQELLYSQEGKPRQSIFYLAHLSDSERMFFITLLLSAIESWMRSQSGTASLRAILYIDEIYGYLPPTANPPSKQPLLRMLKQARAFGLGLLLATQNPVDVDYKGLSNSGTWFIGKLQTDQDKQRLLDGLEGAASGIPRAELDKEISALGKRIFVMHNVHKGSPQVFHTRWTMNFLAGPLTTNQIPALNELAGARQVSPQPITAGKQSIPSAPVDRTGVGDGKSINLPISSTKPELPSGIREYFLPSLNSLQEAYLANQRSMPVGAILQAVIHKPALLAFARVRFLERKYGIDKEIGRGAIVTDLDRRGIVHWEAFIHDGDAFENIDGPPNSNARYSAIEPPLDDGKLMSALQKDFSDWTYRNTSMLVRVNSDLKVFVDPETSQADFMKACAEAAAAGRDAEIAKKSAQIDRQIQNLEARLGREERELREDETDLQHRKWEEMGTHAENVLGLFGRSRSSRRLSSSLSKRRLTENAKADVEESVESIAQFKQQLEALKAQREVLIREIDDRWAQLVNDHTVATIKPKKTDVFVSHFGVGWLPYFLVQTDNGVIELPAYRIASK